jgi:hypothetical protein
VILSEWHAAQSFVGAVPLSEWHTLHPLRVTPSAVTVEVKEWIAETSADMLWWHAAVVQPAELGTACFSAMLACVAEDVPTG